MTDGRHDGLWAGVIFASVASVFSLFVAMGPCVRQEKVEQQVDHLETRLDNLRDR